MHMEVCGGRHGLCDAMRPTSGADLLRFLRKVNFTGKYYDLTYINVLQLLYLFVYF